MNKRIVDWLLIRLGRYVLRDRLWMGIHVYILGVRADCCVIDKKAAISGEDDWEGKVRMRHTKATMVDGVRILFDEDRGMEARAVVAGLGCVVGGVRGGERMVDVERGRMGDGVKVVGRVGVVVICPGGHDCGGGEKGEGEGIVRAFVLLGSSTCSSHGWSRVRQEVGMELCEEICLYRSERVKKPRAWLRLPASTSTVRET